MKLHSYQANLSPPVLSGAISCKSLNLFSTWFKPRENILPEFLLCLRSKFRITICDNNLIKYILVWRSKNIWLWLKLIFLDAGGTQKHPLSFRITHHCHIHHHHLHHLEHHFLSVVWSDDLFPPKGPSKPPHWQDPRSSPHSSPSSSTTSSQFQYFASLSSWV